jgi:hypothetical protein
MDSAYSDELQLAGTSRAANTRQGWLVGDQLLIRISNKSITLNPGKVCYTKLLD